MMKMAANREEYAIRFFLEAAKKDMKWGWGVSSNDIEKEEISQPTAYRAQERLVDAGLLEKKRGNTYYLTDEGRELLNRILEKAGGETL